MATSATVAVDVNRVSLRMRGGGVAGAGVAVTVVVVAVVVAGVVTVVVVVGWTPNQASPIGFGCRKTWPT